MKCVLQYLKDLLLVIGIFEITVAGKWCKLSVVIQFYQNLITLFELLMKNYILLKTMFYDYTKVEKNLRQKCSKLKASLSIYKTEISVNTPISNILFKFASFTSIVQNVFVLALCCTRILCTICFRHYLKSKIFCFLFPCCIFKYSKTHL